jgi:uncharacterized protein (DUF983 family)
MKSFTAYAIIWIVTALAVSVAIWTTKSADPLWAMFIPLFIDLKIINN